MIAKAKINLRNKVFATDLSFVALSRVRALNDMYCAVPQAVQFLTESNISRTVEDYKKERRYDIKIS